MGSGHGNAMMRPATFLLASALLPHSAAAEPASGAVETASQNAASADESTTRTDARLDLTQLYSEGNVTTRHLSYSDLRGRLVSDSPFGLTGVGLQLDGRLRYGWTAITEERTDLSRASVQYGSRESWMLTVGRQVLPTVAGASLDGAFLGLGLTEQTQAGLFGGLKPHPLDGRLDTRFSIVGAGYDSRGTTMHNGGLVFEMFRGAADRLYFTERFYIPLGTSWVFYGHTVVDFLAPRGILDELDVTQKGEDLGLAGLDLTQGQLMLRYRQPQLFDISLLASHIHTVLPNKWWTSRIQNERARRGFVIDGFDPVGTRRSRLQLTTTLRSLGDVTPYIKLRYDRRHGDSANGYEARPGAKLLFGSTGYLDAYYAFHRYFETRNNRAGVNVGKDVLDFGGIDGGLHVIHSKPPLPAESLWLLDIYGSVRAGLGVFHESLSGLDLIAQVSLFIEPDVVYQIYVLRVAYRYRD